MDARMASGRARQQQQRQDAAARSAAGRGGGALRMAVQQADQMDALQRQQLAEASFAAARAAPAATSDARSSGGRRTQRAAVEDIWVLHPQRGWCSFSDPEIAAWWSARSAARHSAIRGRAAVAAAHGRQLQRSTPRTFVAAGHAQDFYSDSASEDEHFAPAQHVEYMHSMRECWERYDAARDAVENEREEADARLAQARETLHDELSEAQREWVEDGRYHAERAAGLSPGASDEFSPRSFDSLDDIQQELAHVELRSDDEVDSRGEEASESPLIWDQAMANYFEEQEVDFEAYAHCFEPEEEEYSSQPESEHGPD
eukprot:Tamp_09450.p1 GENE.Tamp_09450~~Tamp_09450.p1  ORF type:complete len:316 (+),score=68.70 Tamp_09450:543-1490(+)